MFKTIVIKVNHLLKEYAVSLCGTTNTLRKEIPSYVK